MGRPKGDARAQPSAPPASQPSAAESDVTVRVAELKRLANAAIGALDMQAALRHLDAAVKLAPEEAAHWRNRAYVHEMLGQPAAALSDAQQCLHLAPDSSKGHLRAGRALVGLGRIDEALELLERAVSRDTQDYGLRQALQDAQQQRAAPRAPASNDGSGAASQPELAATASSSDSGGGNGGGGAGASKPLAANPYYYATGSVEQHLPMQPPQRIASGATALQQQEPRPIASGAVQLDLEKKGANSYYYAHARTTDYQVPLVPKKIAADGSLTPWQPTAVGDSETVSPVGAPPQGDLTRREAQQSR